MITLIQSNNLLILSHNQLPDLTPPLPHQLSEPTPYPQPPHLWPSSSRYHHFFLLPPEQQISTQETSQNGSALANCFLSDTKANMLFPDVHTLLLRGSLFKNNILKLLNNVLKYIISIRSPNVGKAYHLSHFLQGKTEDHRGEGYLRIVRELLGLAVFQQIREDGETSQTDRERASQD